MLQQPKCCLQVLKSPHWTLVTLLLCNAAALEVSHDAVIAYQTSMHCMLFCRYADSLTLVGFLQALPIFLDKLLSPLLSVVLSVTAVLLVGKPCCCSCLYTCTLHHI